MKSRLFSTVVVLLLTLILPVKSFCQSASQICIPVKAFDGLVEDSYNKTKFENLYNEEVLTSTDLRKEVHYSSQEINSQKLAIESLEQGNIATEFKLANSEADTKRLVKKVNHLKAVVHVLEGIGGVLLILVAL